MNHKISDVKLKGLPRKREGLPREKKNRKREGKDINFVQLSYTQEDLGVTILKMKTRKTGRETRDG